MRKTTLGTAIAAVALLMGTSTFANANTGEWEHTATYVHTNAKDVDFNGDALMLGVGYNVPVGPHTTITPEVSFGKGVGSSTSFINGTPVSMNIGDLFVANVRVSIAMTDVFSLHFTPGLSYSELEADTGFGGIKAVSDGEWDPLFGAGFGAKITKNTEVSVNYSRIFGSDEAGDTDVFGAKIHYRF